MGGNAPAASDATAFSGQLRRLSISLAPLRQVEETLSNRIAGARPPEDTSGNHADNERYNPAKASEIMLRSGSNWTAFLRFRRGSMADADRTEKAEAVQIRRILSACAKDIVEVWTAAEIQQGLRDREITLQEQSGFFLDQVERICREDYIPTPNDILRARVHTVGPEEHIIYMENGA
ncbi:unnamed protein product [Mycena citricolor]|uniref:Uncharacterized protein n=1 Tax=Mycena citricolor TaxID=2018698 RepID=A0AAD2HA93_9AGAR|nr:unnamed protein product [Mycena citricolor]